MERDKIALFDMDNTLCAYQETIDKDLEKLRAPHEQKISVNQAPDPDQHIRNRIDLIKRQPGWWLNLPELESGMTLFKLSIELGFIPHVLTQGPGRFTNAWTEKVEWCHKHLRVEDKPVDVTLTRNKGLVYGTILVDDWPEYITSWLNWRKRGLVIMPDCASNQGFSHPQVVRYKHGETSLDHIRQLLLISLNR